MGNFLVCHDDDRDERDENRRLRAEVAHNAWAVPVALAAKEWRNRCCPDPETTVALIDAIDAAPPAALARAEAEREVVRAANDLTITAHEMGVMDPVSHIAVAVDLRKYAAKEHAVFAASARLAALKPAAQTIGEMTGESCSICGRPNTWHPDCPVCRERRKPAAPDAPRTERRKGERREEGDRRFIGSDRRRTAQEEPKVCRCGVCRGTGIDPMSDTVSSLPCQQCHGSGWCGKPIRLARDGEARP